MQLAHHLSQLAPRFEISQRVVMVAQQSRHPRSETMLRCVLIKLLPENLLCPFRLECMQAIANFGGDEVDAVVSVPVLESVATLMCFSAGVGAFPKSRHSGYALYCTNAAPRAIFTRFENREIRAR